MVTIEKIQDFNSWMLKIKNIHYSDNEKMDKAYSRLKNDTVKNG